nr:MAG: capsid protein [Cressdnaviricota sp.]
MPGQRRSYRPRYNKAPMRKRFYPKKGKRFTKGKYVKSTSAQSTFRGQQIPNLLNVKFNWDQTLTGQEISTTQVNFFWIGNSLNPSPASGASGNFSALAGDIVPPNIQQFTGMYQNSITAGSGIKIRIQSTSDIGGEIQGVLVALPYDGIPPGTSASLYTVVTGFDALSYDNACALPYAHRFMFNANSGASNSNHQYKGFRKTKVMCSARILKDDDNFEQDLDLSSEVGGFGPPPKGFVWLLKLLSSTATVLAPIPFVISTKMSFYSALRTRIQTSQAVLT